MRYRVRLDSLDFCDFDTAGGTEDTLDLAEDGDYEQRGKGERVS